MTLCKLSGKPKAFPPIASLSKMLLLLFLARDIHLSLILNFRASSGLKEKKDLKC
jgi:hypothetical protein